MSASQFPNIQLSHLNQNGELLGKEASSLRLQIINQTENLLFRFFKDGNVNTPAANAHLELEIYKDSDVSRVGNTAFVVNHQNGTVMMHLEDQKMREQVAHIVNKYQKGDEHNVFADRTEEGSASQYFQFYGYLSQQQNMMQDYFRTATYQRAILANLEDFRGKVVLDVGAGSGILSFFAAHAGAAKVYGIEASSMATHAESLVYHNRLQNVIKLVPGKVEEVELPEKVDIIISEPMGYMLYNERMLESYLHAKKFLKPGGKMFPTTGDLHVAPFTDSALFMEQMNKANFWYQHSFHGVDLTCLREAAVKEYFHQPVVDTFDMRVLLSQSVVHTVNFEKADELDLHKIEIPLEFVVTQSAELHGLAFWFDVAFIGSQQTVYLSTSPTQPLTHWYQVRCLIDKPIIVTKGQILVGNVALIANKKQSYDVDIEIGIQGTQIRSKNTLDLKNPFFRYTGQPVQAPPGFNETSPSHDYWNQAALDVHNTANSTEMMQNGNAMGMGGMNVSMAMPVAGVQMNGVIDKIRLQGQQTQQQLQVQGVTVPCSIGGGVAPVLLQQPAVQSMSGMPMTGAHTTITDPSSMLQMSTNTTTVYHATS